MGKQKSKKRAQDNNDSGDNPGPLVMCGFQKMVSVGKLTPNHRNPNWHTEDQIKILAKVIAIQGWRAPIVVSSRSQLIVAGHGRFEAAKMLGLKYVPVDFQDFKSDAEELAHMIADNKIAAMSEMEDRAILELVGAIKLEDFDITLTGFSDKDLEAIAEGMKDPVADSEFPVADENIATDYQCPKCQYRWSGKTS